MPCRRRQLTRKMDLDILAPILRKVNCLFHGIFGQLMYKPMIYPIPSRLTTWSVFCPSLSICRQVSLPTTLPRLCSACRGSQNASKLPDPFPQRSCSGCVWYRFNPGENRGEICIPTLKHNGDANVAPMEIYRCQLCGKLMRHLQINNVNHFQLSMKQIFQDLLKEVDRLYYRKTPKSPSSVISKSGIPVRTSAVNASGAAGQQAAFRTVNASGAAGQQAAVARKDTKRSWILFIGNVTDSIHRPVILNSLIPANGKEFDNANLLPFDNLHERFSTLNTDISRFECSPNIWDKKALQRKQQMDQKCPSKEAQPLASVNNNEVENCGFQEAIETAEVVETKEVLHEEDESLLEQQRLLSKAIAEAVLQNEPSEVNNNEENQDNDGGELNASNELYTKTLCMTLLVCLFCTILTMFQPLI